MSVETPIGACVCRGHLSGHVSVETPIGACDCGDTYRGMCLWRHLSGHVSVETPIGAGGTGRVV